MSPWQPRLVCYRCCKPAVACICASIEPVANRTGVTILQHPSERFHPTGTVRIARLALQNLRVEWCTPWEDASAARERIPDGAVLLYPGPAAQDLEALAESERPFHIVVLDGTWFHTRKIYQAHRWLRELPQVRLASVKPSRYRVRREPRDGCVATIEAIFYALRILEADTAGLDGLLRSFAAMVDRQASYMGLEDVAGSVG